MWIEEGLHSFMQISIVCTPSDLHVGLPAKIINLLVTQWMMLTCLTASCPLGVTSSVFLHQSANFILKRTVSFCSNTRPNRAQPGRPVPFLNTHTCTEMCLVMLYNLLIWYNMVIAVWVFSKDTSESGCCSQRGRGGSCCSCCSRNLRSTPAEPNVVSASCHWGKHLSRAISKAHRQSRTAGSDKQHKKRRIH